jgi:hypothetical protein
VARVEDRNGLALVGVTRSVTRDDDSGAETPADLERTTGFEPATPTLARWCSTTEPRPQTAHPS